MGDNINYVNIRSEDTAVPAPDCIPAGVSVRQVRRIAKSLSLDGKTGLRNTDLAQWNNEYLQYMDVVSKQKRHNRLSTQAKKNAPFWVFGLGIGSVGIGLGATRMPHPLQCFSGDELYGSLCGGTLKGSRKRRRVPDEVHDTDSERRVRGREQEEEHVGRGGGIQSSNARNAMQDVRVQRYWLLCP